MKSSFSYPHSKVVFEGKRIDVVAFETQDRLGNTSRKEIVDHPGAVVILPLLDQDHLVFIRNERLAVGQTLLELPAGTLELKEPPLSCAYRELEEETGYRASKMTFLFSFFTSPGFCNEVMHAFVASDLKAFSQQLEDSENIQVEIIERKKIPSLINSGFICDAKTLCTLFRYQFQ